MRILVTVIGKDKSGIIAEVSTLLANNNVNIEDISQTIVGDNFTMIMLCKINDETLTLATLKTKLVELGDKIGVSIHVQHEDIFKAMHNV